MTVSTLDLTTTFRFGDRGPECLLLHGFTGSPWDLRPLAEALGEAGFQGEVPRLPGHGISPNDMGASSAADWLEVADQALAEVFRRGGTPVRLAGFSMGALLSIILAARRPEAVHCLALLAPAARLSGLPAAVARALRHWPIVERLKPRQPKGPPDISDPHARAAAPTWPDFPTAVLRDLFLLQDRAHAAAPSVQAPALLVLAPEDHVVDEAAARKLYRLLPKSHEVVMLAKGYHGLARDVSRAQLAETVKRFFGQSV